MSTKNTREKKFIMNSLFNQPTAIFRQPLMVDNNLSSFVYTNALLDHSDDLNVNLIHFWSLTDTVILGLKDQRLPHLSNALTYLKHHHFNYFMRNSGGLAVVSDAGVLNFSIFLPWHLVGKELQIDEAYQVMTSIISKAFPELTIETGEITHSYCPGTFDISVNGQKIGGMAQRRNKNGAVVMLYLSVCGNQTSRGELVRDFYSHGLQNEENKWNFPDVWPTAMTTVEELLHQPLTMQDAEIRLSSVFTNQEADINQLLWSAPFIESLAKQVTYMQRLQERIN